MTDDTSKPRVLLVDDDKFLLDMYTMKFTQQGFDIHACLSARNALDVLRGGFIPEVILFDIIMPQHDGYSFLQSLRDEKLAPSALRIALTNQSDDEEQKHAKELGADRFLVKASMIPSEVVNIVKKEIAAKNKA